MKFASWFLPTAVAAIAMARISVWLQQVGLAPILVVPLLVGAAVGLLASMLAGQSGESSRVRLAVGLVVSALLMAAASHGFFYLDYCRQFEANVLNEPKVQLWALQDPDFQPRPHTLWKFLGASALENWPLWIADAAAMIAGALCAGLLSPLRQSEGQPHHGDTPDTERTYK